MEQFTANSYIFKSYEDYKKFASFLLGASLSATFSFTPESLTADVTFYDAESFDNVCSFIEDEELKCEVYKFQDEVQELKKKLEEKNLLLQATAKERDNYRDMWYSTSQKLDDLKEQVKAFGILLRVIC
jgi:hypothetical protein